MKCLAVSPASTRRCCRSTAAHALAEKVAVPQPVSALSWWCAGAASLSPTRRYNGEYGELELRRRQSLERVHAVLITEDGPGE
jgi:hypothetical protein